MQELDRLAAQLTDMGAKTTAAPNNAKNAKNTNGGSQNGKANHPHSPSPSPPSSPASSNSTSTNSSSDGQQQQRKGFRDDARRQTVVEKNTDDHDGEEDDIADIDGEVDVDDEEEVQLKDPQLKIGGR